MVLEKKLNILLALGIVILCGSTSYLLWFALNSSELLNDFWQDYAASVRLGSGVNIYEPTELVRVPDGRKLLIPCDHPPTVGLLYYPLSFFSLETAFFLLSSINIISLWLVVAYVGKRLDHSTTTILLTIGLLHLWPPVQLAIESGQPTILITTLLLFGTQFLSKKRLQLSSILFTLSVGLKIFPAFFGIYLAQMRRWRALFIFSAYAMVLLLTSISVIGIDSHLTYANRIVSEVVTVWGGHSQNMSLHGMVYKVLGAPPSFLPELYRPFGVREGVARLLSYTLRVLALLLFFYFLRNSHKLASKRIELQLLEFTLVCMAMILISPICWLHYFVFLIPAIQVLCSSKVIDQNTRLRRLFFLSLLLLSIPSQLLSALAHNTEISIATSIAPLVAQLPSLGLFVFCYIVYWEYSRLMKEAINT